MAMTSDAEFAVEISADDQTSKGLVSAGRQAELTTKQTAALEAQMAELTKAMMMNKASIDAMAASYSAASGQAAALSSAMDAQQVAGKQTAVAMTSASSSLHTLAVTAGAVSSALNVVVSVFQLLSNPKNLTTLSKILSVMATVAGIKGNKELAQNLTAASEGAKEAAFWVDKVHESGLDIHQTVDRVEALAKGLENAKAAALAFSAVAGLAVSVMLIGRQSKEAGDAINYVIGKLGGVSAAAGKLTAALDNTGTFAGLRRQISGMAEVIDGTGQRFQALGKNSKVVGENLHSMETSVRGVGSRIIWAADKIDVANGKVSALGSNLTTVAPFLGRFTTLTKGAGMTLDVTGQTMTVLSDRLRALAALVNGGASAFEAMRVNLPTTIKAFEVIGSTFRGFSSVIGGVSRDMGNLIGIFKAIVVTTAPVLGNFGRMIAVTGTATASLFGLGTILLRTDSTMAKVAGGSMIAVAVSIGGIVVALKAMSSAIGQLVSNVGVSLFTFFDAGIEGAKADEAATESFRTAILRLGGSTAAQLPVLDRWNEKINDITVSSKMGGSEAQAYIQQIARMGQEFGLTQRTQEMLADSVLAYAKNGEEAAAVAGVVRLALNGQAKQAEELGIHLNDAALNSSDFSKSSGKMADEMTKQEKVLTRLNLLFAQAATAQVASAAAGETLAQIQHKVAVASDEVSAQFANASIPVYKLLRSAQFAVLEQLLRLPQAVKNAINTVTTWTGGILIIVGQILKWSFAIGGLIALVSTLNAVIKASATVQAVLTAAFAVTNAAVGVQAATVTSLSVVWANFAILARGVAVAALQAVWAAITATTAAIWRMTVAILSNPLFWQAAAIVSAILLVAQAMREIFAESTLIKRVIEDLTGSYSTNEKESGKLTKAWDAIKDAARRLISTLVDLTKFMISGVLSTVQLVSIGFVKLKMLFADEADEQAYTEMLESMEAELDNLHQVQMKALAGVATFGEETAIAADIAAKFAEQTKEGAAAAEEAADAWKALKQEVADLSKAAAQAAASARTAGLDEIQQARLKRANAMQEIAAVEARVKATGRLTDALRSQLSAARQNQNVAAELAIAAAITKMAEDATKAADDAKKAAEEAGLSEIALGEKRMQAQIAAIDVVRQRAMREGHLTDALMEQLDAAELAAIAAADITGLKIKAKAIDEVTKANADLGFELAKMGKTEEQVAELEAQRALAGVDAAEKKAEAEGILTDALKEQFNIRRKLIEEQAASKSVPIMKQVMEISLTVGRGVMVAFEAGAAVLAGVLTGQWLESFSSGVETIADTPSQMTMALARLDRAVERIAVSLPMIVTKLVESMDRIVTRIVNAMPLVADALAKAIPQIAAAFADAIPRVVRAVAESMPEIIAAVGTALVLLIDSIPEIVDALFDNLPAITEAIFAALPQIAAAIARAIPAVIENVMEHMDEIVAAFTEGFIVAAVQIPVVFVDYMLNRGGAERIAGAIGRGIIRAIRGFFEGIFKGLSRLLGGNFKIKAPDIQGSIEKGAQALKKVFGGDSSQLFSVRDLQEGLGKQAEAAAEMLRDLIGEAEDAGRTIWDYFIQALKDGWDWLKRLGGKIWEGLREAVTEVVTWFMARGAEIWNGFVGAVGLVLDWFQVRGKEIWDGFVAAVSQVGGFFQQLGALIWGGFTAAYMAAATWFVEKGTQIWVGFTTALKDPAKFFGDLGQKIVDGLKGGIAGSADSFLGLGKKIVDGFWGRITAIWDDIPSIGKRIVDGLWGQLMAIWDNIPAIGKRIVDGLWGQLVVIWDHIPKVGKRIVDGFWGQMVALWDQFSTIGSNMAVGFWNKLIGFDWESLLGVSGGGGGEGIPYVPGIMNGGVVKALYRATGGDTIFKPQGTDTVPAMLTPGEFVVRRDQAQANMPLLRSINSGNGPVTGGGPVTYNITINARTNLDAASIRREVIPEIERHLKKKSQDGGFVITKSGVRS